MSKPFQINLIIDRELIRLSPDPKAYVRRSMHQMLDNSLNGAMAEELTMDDEERSSSATERKELGGR